MLKLPPTPFESGMNSARNYLEKLANGSMPQLFNIDGLREFEAGPGLLTIVGGIPGAGKTAFLMMIIFELLKKNPEAIVYIANKEMSFESLLRRELARVTNVSHHSLRFGTDDRDEIASIQEAIIGLQPLLERIVEMKEPLNNASLLGLIEKPTAILIVDYLQKFLPPGETKQGVGELMGYLRLLARKGWAVLAASATSRGDIKTKGQASFRDSSEIEYNADAAYLLVEAGKSDSNATPSEIEIDLVCVKNRNGFRQDIHLQFNRSRMEFTPRRETVFDEWNPPEDL